MAPGRTAFLFTALALLTVALFTADLLVGSVSVAPADIWAALTGGDCDPAIRDIILSATRWPGPMCWASARAPGWV